MSKFVFFCYHSSYEMTTLDAFRMHQDVLIFKNYKNKYINKLFRLYNAWPLNKYIELPFKKWWFRSCVQNMGLCGIDINEDVYFIFSEGFHLTYSKQFLQFLKKKYNNSKFYFKFLNPVDNYNLLKLNTVKKYYDVILTFNRKDADKYNFSFFAKWPKKMPAYHESNYIDDSDLFFVGKDKGRLEQLIKIYEKMTTENVKCDFHIVDVPVEKQQYPDKISYNKQMPYEEVLARVMKTNCVLEYLINDEKYCSLRTTEALHYKKKLLTTNSTVVNEPFYNPAVIQFFSDVSEIDVDFVRTKANVAEFPDYDLGNCESVLKSLKALLKQEHPGDRCILDNNS